MIKLFYSLFDSLLFTLVYPFVDYSQIEKVLKSELNITEYSGITTTNFSRHAEMIHSRVATLVGHISIMIAVLMLSLSTYEKDTTQSYIVIGEIVLYLLVTVACLRCLRAYGFEKNIDDDNYKKSLFDDLALRFAAYRVSNFLAITLTLGFVLLVFFYPPIKEG